MPYKYEIINCQDPYNNFNIKRTYKVVKFTFDNNTSKKPILSTLVREIDFDFTIINGHIDKTANANIGTLFVQLIGTKENTDKVISRLNELGILTEVL